MTIGPADATRRFTDRVADYVRYRPGYPEGVVETLRAEGAIRPGSVVADVGSGTGISTALFLGAGCVVFAVEPNAAMRAAAEERLGNEPGFHSVPASAERTTLPDASVDLAVAAQAFHWFDAPAARLELARILRPGGQVALLWNRRLADTTPFLRDYEALLREHGTDYRQVEHRDITPAQLADFYRGPYRSFTFPNQQSLDHAGLEGRLLSSSYTPPAGDPRRPPMLRDLRAIFDVHQEYGQVQILYATELHLGSL